MIFPSPRPYSPSPGPNFLTPYPSNPRPLPSFNPYMSLLMSVLQLSQSLFQALGDWNVPFQPPQPQNLSYAPPGYSREHGFPDFQGVKPRFSMTEPSVAPPGYQWHVAPNDAVSLRVKGFPDIIMSPNNEGRWMPSLDTRKYPPLPKNTPLRIDDYGLDGSPQAPKGYEYVGIPGTPSRFRALAPKGLQGVHMMQTPDGIRPLFYHHPPNA